MQTNSSHVPRTFSPVNYPPSDLRTNFLDEAKQNLSTLRGEVVENPWRWEPLTFDEFVYSKEHMGFPPLSPKQLEAAHAILGHDPKHLFNPAFKEFTTAVCLWGKGSLAFDEPFMDCVTGEEHTVEEWSGLGKQISVKAFDFKNRHLVTTKIDAPVLEDVGRLVEVHTDAKYTVRVSIDHKFWVRPGKWAPVRELKAGDEIGCTMGLPLLFEPKFTTITGIRPIAETIFTKDCFMPTAARTVWPPSSCATSSTFCCA
jgi:hypothetical protein